MKSNTKKFLSVLLSVLMLFTVVIPAVSAVAGDGSVELAVTPIDPSTLNIPKLGEVEAEDLIPDEKLPYGLDETVRVSIFLAQPSARDAGYAVQGVSENPSAVSYQETLRRNQASVQAKIEAATGRAIDVKWNLTLLTNAISANVRYGDIPTIEKLDGVLSVEIENRYEAPVTAPEADAPQMTNARDMVRSSFGNATNYNGAGQKLAIIDTGLDVDHQSVNADAFDQAIAEDRANGKTVDLLTSQQVTNLKSQLNGRNGIYKSTKLPFIYNYIDENTNVTHEQDTGSEHGSHVAGIAAANRYIKSGSSYVDAASSVGVVGQADPRMAANYGFTQPVLAAELAFDEMFARVNPKKTYKPLPKYPATTRDFSFVCDEDTEVGAIEGVMKRAGGKLVEKIALFDIYRGEQLGEGKKSVSLRITLRAPDRTLTVEEADKVCKKILNDLKFKMGLTLRS